jgi:ribosomal small subunit protein bTHX
VVVDRLLDQFSGRYIHSFPLEAITGMGKGDHRTKKGKRFRGTHGKTRPRKKKKKVAQKKD